jgi:hypothetical protein
MMPADPTQSASEPVRRFFGGALMAIGILIMVLAGLCTGGVAVMVLVEPSSPGEFISVLLEAVLVAAIPAGIGAGLFFLGRAIMPKKKPQETETPR